MTSELQHMVKGLVRSFNNSELFTLYCECITENFVNERKKLGDLIIVELILRNTELVYGNEQFESLINKSIDVLSGDQEYLRRFRQKADKKYKKECQKEYIRKILEKSSLESVPVNMIVEFL